MRWYSSGVLGKLKQLPLPTEQRLGRPSSSPHIDWDSPTTKRSTRKAINRTVDKKTKNLLSIPTNELKIL
ncbi:hypothetical protein M433DRAFT_158701 [Acidomyces richmondensis BFW]|nr:hypothetical protein M433DRAFT_158701 [Acidomyces richmondensis BFW]